MSTSCASPKATIPGVTYSQSNAWPAAPRPTGGRSVVWPNGEGAAREPGHGARQRATGGSRREPACASCLRHRFGRAGIRRSTYAPSGLRPACPCPRALRGGDARYVAVSEPSECVSSTAA